MKEYLLDYFTGSPLKIAAQIIGLIALIEGLFIYQQSSRRKILILKGSNDLIWAAHYALLGAVSGAVLDVIAVFRAIVFYNKDKRWASSKLWLLVFLAVTWVGIALSWQGPVSLLAGFGSSFAVTGYYLTNERLTRLFNIPALILWLVYSALNYSFGGIVNNVITFCSLIVGIVRFDVLNNNKKAKTEDNSEENQ